MSISVAAVTTRKSFKLAADVGAKILRDELRVFRAGRSLLLRIFLLINNIGNKYTDHVPLEDSLY